MRYDIIGDLHGHASELTALLRLLGYQERGGAWRHPERTAVFVGDFIDRGPEQLEVVAIVRRMFDAGSAQAVMGNHELNAIAWHTPDPAHPGEYLRPHGGKYGAGNLRQHAAFLAAVEGNPALHRELVEWFLTLPLWLELGALRVVHACWHPIAVDYLGSRLAPGRRLSPELLPEATVEPTVDADKDSAAPTVFKSVEWLLKGIEVPLPPPHSFVDEDQKVRHRVRVRWWDPGATTFRQAAVPADHLRAPLPDSPIPPAAVLAPRPDRPTFFGHYWLTGAPAPLGSLVACLDYAIAKGGRLAAYRHDGEPVLEAGRFVSVGRSGT